MSRKRTTRRRGGGPRHDDGALVVYGVNAVQELLHSGAAVRRLYLEPGPRGVEIARTAREHGISVEAADRRTLEQQAATPHHQGAVAIAAPFRYRTLEDLLAGDPQSLLLLDGIQDPRNLGAILRTGCAAGVGGVILPADRSVGITPVVAATSAGLLFRLPIVRVPNLVRAMGRLKEAGFWLIGLVPRGGEVLSRAAPPPRRALVVGGEGEGLRPLVRRTCDLVVSVPMVEGVDSLNAAVAAGIALYALVMGSEQR